MYTDVRNAETFTLCLIASIVAAMPLAARGDDNRAVQKMLVEKSKSVVTIRSTLRPDAAPGYRGEGPAFNNRGEGPAFNNEIAGLIVDPKGIVLCSNTELDGYVKLMNLMAGSMTETGGCEQSMQVSNVKVLVGDDEVGLAAEILARDTELDLAWLRIKDTEGKSLQFVELAKGETPIVGQRTLMMSRMAKRFGRVPVITEGRVGGQTTRPRQLYLPSVRTSVIGAPVYTESGVILGVTVLQLPESLDFRQSPLSMMMRQGNMWGEVMSGLILPASVVAEATKGVLDRAAGEK